jgi:hypothetical protein
MELDSDYIDELAGTDNLPPVTVTKDMVLVDGFHRLEAAKRRGDEKIQTVIRTVLGRRKEHEPIPHKNLSRNYLPKGQMGYRQASQLRQRPPCAMEARSFLVISSPASTLGRTRSRTVVL